MSEHDCELADAVEDVHSAILERLRSMVESTSTVYDDIALDHGERLWPLDATKGAVAKGVRALASAIRGA